MYVIIYSFGDEEFLKGVFVSGVWNIAKFSGKYWKCIKKLDVNTIQRVWVHVQELYLLKGTCVCKSLSIKDSGM